MATMTTHKKIERWSEADVAAAARDWAERLIESDFISVGPRALRCIRLTPTTLAVQYDNGQTFAIVVEEIKMEV